MNTFGAIPAAAAMPAFALAADASGATAPEGAADFSDVLQQLMAGTPRAGAGIDLPLEDEDGAADETDEGLDALLNANVVDLGIQPMIRLTLATVWTVPETSATAANAAVVAEAAMGERSVSPPAILGQPVASADVPALPDAGPSIPFEALMAEAGETVAETAPAATATAPEPAPAAAARTPGTVAPGKAVPGPQDTIPTPQALEAAPPPATGQVAASAAVSPEIAAVPAPPRRGADKAEPAHAAARIVAEAGQRAYAAAASEESQPDTQNGAGHGRHNERASAEPVAATSGPAATAPFYAIPDRPAAPVSATLAAPVVVAAEAVEAAVASELPAQVVQSIRMQAIEGGGEAIVRLRPDYLGELVIAVKVEHGAVTAALQSDTPAVRKWVEGNEATLRQALAEHGLHLERLTIEDSASPAETGERERQDPQEQEEQSQSQSRRQRKPAPDATFEVIV